MFVGPSILQNISYWSLELAKVGTYVLISRQDLSNITARVLVQLFIVTEDNDRDID
jgi:hypothetical protein